MDPAFKIVMFVGGAALLVGGIYCLIGLGSKCSRCSEWFAVNLVKKQQLKVEQAAKDITRDDKHFDKEGHVTGTTERKERVYGKNITYDNFYECKKCGNKYNSMSVEWKDA